MNQSGLKRSPTDLGVCAKDRVTAHTCMMPYHMDLPVIGRLYKPPLCSHSQHTIPTNFYTLLRFSSKYST
jgi:hypothetical protein